MIFSLILPFITIFTCNASPTSSFHVRVGDWWTMYTNVSMGTPASVGNSTIIEISTLNNTDYVMPGPTHFYGDAVFINMYWANASFPTWILVSGDYFLAMYNLSDPNVLTYSNDGGFICNYYFLSCVNLTAFNITMSAYGGTNVSTRTGLTFTYWEGFVNGSGVDTASFRLVVTLDPVKYVVSIWEAYKWNTTTRTWDLREQTTLIDKSWGSQTPAQPPIPGFTILFIACGIIVVMGIFKKINKNEKSDFLT